MDYIMQKQKIKITGIILVLYLDLFFLIFRRKFIIIKSPIFRRAESTFPFVKSKQFQIVKTIRIQIFMF